MGIIIPFEGLEDQVYTRHNDIFWSSVFIFILLFIIFLRVWYRASKLHCQYFTEGSEIEKDSISYLSVFFFVIFKCYETWPLVTSPSSDHRSHAAALVLCPLNLQQQAYLFVCEQRSVARPAQPGIYKNLEEDSRVTIKKKKKNTKN